MEKILFSREDYDSIVGTYRPNGTSKTWYLKETGKVQRLFTMGNWNLFDENGVWIEKMVVANANFPPDMYGIATFKTANEIGDNVHLYLIKVNNPAYFTLNENIGFNVIHPKFLSDIQNGRSKIIIHHPYEGYSGMVGNRDLHIVEKWRKESGLPEHSIYFLTGNLLAENVAKKDNLKINVIPISAFDNWVSIDITTPYIPFNPGEEKNLFVSYNRNSREHRTIFVLKLLEEKLLDSGLVSFKGYPNLRSPDHMIKDHSFSKETIAELSSRLPLEINGADLNYNMAGNITYDDYEKTFISVISETLTEQDCLFLSEKIWKPISVGHPFMVLGNPHTLQYLKSIGYKTFDKWIDESYDDSPILYDRIEGIINELKKLSMKSIDELKSIRLEMNEVCKHNKHHFIKQKRNNWGVNGSSTILINEIMKIHSELIGKESTPKIEELTYKVWDRGSISTILIDIEKYNPSSIIIAAPEEWEIGVEFRDTEFIKELTQILLDKDINLKIILGTDDSLNNYYDNAIQFPHANTEIIRFPMFWAYYTYSSIVVKNNSIIELSSRKHDIDKLFISLNNKAHYHRCELMDLLCERDLLKYGNVSWIEPDSNPDNYNFKCWTPSKLVFNDSYTKTLDAYLQIPKEYKTSFVNIISESTLNVPFLTEKTFMAILLCQPFLIYGACNIHKVLVKYGFDLYDEIFDYSFDELENGTDRINGILDNLDEIKDKNLNLMRGLIEPKIRKNKNRLITIINDKTNIPAEILSILEKNNYLKEKYNFLFENIRPQNKRRLI